MNYSEKAIGVAGLILLIFLSSCEHKVSMKTIVHEDGSLDKTLTLSQGKSNATKNYFNISEQQGWVVSIDSVQKGHSKNDTSKKEKEYKYTFRKTFSSAEDANKELAQPNDSLFQITSHFEKQFRWFYTSYFYSETYHQLNRFKYPTNDYLTDFDFQFIETLPAESKKISRADSLFLIKLNERIFDNYANRAFFEEFFEMLLNVVAPKQKHNLELKKEEIFKAFKNDEGEFTFFAESGNAKSFDIIAPQMADSLGIDKRSSQYRSLLKRIESKINFMSWARDGKYQNSVELKGEIVSHNADSVSGNTFLWQPPYLKFAFKDYTMYAKTRTPNWWAWILSLLILLVAGWSFVRKRD